MTRYRTESDRTRQPVRVLAASLLTLFAGGCGTDAALTATQASGNPEHQQPGAQSGIPTMAGANLLPVSEPATDVEMSPAPSDGNELPISPTDATPGTVDHEPSTFSKDTVVVCSSPDDHFRQRTLELINAARAEARYCGADYFAGASSVAWNDSLLQAARAHSQDMTEHNFFDHMSSDGGTVGTRVTSTGYRWSTVGENIAAGQQSASMAIDGWIDSPGHCRNLMNPAFIEVALACAQDDGSDYVRYWTNVLAAPR